MCSVLFQICFFYFSLFYLKDSEGQQSNDGRSKSKKSRRWSSESVDSLRQSKPTKVRRSYDPTHQAEASSTTYDNQLHRPSDPADWSIDDVMKHICDADPALATHAELFRKHVRNCTYAYYILK